MNCDICGREAIVEGASEGMQKIINEIFKYQLVF